MYVHVYNLADNIAQTHVHLHVFDKGECCSCLGTATNLLDIYVINHGRMYVVIQTAYKPFYAALLLSDILTCEKMHTQVNMQYAYSLLKIHHTHTCMYIVHVHSSTLWPMVEDLLLPADPEDRSRESFTVSVSMVKKGNYLHDYN